MPNYTLNDASRGLKWGKVSYGTAGGVVKVSFAARDLPNQAFDFDPLTAAMKNEVKLAFKEWSYYANIQFKLVSDGSGTNTGGIRIGLSDLDGVGRTEGLTKRMVYSNGNIKAAQIAIDSNEKWHLANGKVVDSKGMPFYDAILHEIGHAIGLNHNNSEKLVMNSTLKKIYNLQPGDIAGATYIYGYNPHTAVDLSSVVVRNNNGKNEYYTTAEPGDTLSYTVQVSNYNYKKAYVDDATVHLYLTRNANVPYRPGHDIDLGTHHYHLTKKPFDLFDVRLHFPSNISTSGEWAVMAEADPKHVYYDIRRDNNAEGTIVKFVKAQSSSAAAASNETRHEAAKPSSTEFGAHDEPFRFPAIALTSNSALETIREQSGEPGFSDRSLHHPDGPHYVLGQHAIDPHGLYVKYFDLLHV